MGANSANERFMIGLGQSISEREGLRYVDAYARWLPLVEERAHALPLVGHRFRVPGALELLSDGISSNGKGLKRLISARDQKSSR